MTQRTYNTVLLAEGDEDDCIFFTEALNKVLPAASLNMCKNGDSIIGMLEENSQIFDIVFLDLKLQEHSGSEVLAHIRSSKSLKEKLVIVLTAYDTYGHINQCYKLGANFYIVKPFSFTGLSNHLAECFARIDKFGAKQPPMSEFLIQTPAV